MRGLVDIEVICAARLEGDDPTIGNYIRCSRGKGHIRNVVKIAVKYLDLIPRAHRNGEMIVLIGVIGTLLKTELVIIGNEDLIWLGCLFFKIGNKLKVENTRIHVVFQIVNSFLVRISIIVILINGQVNE